MLGDGTYQTGVKLSLVKSNADDRTSDNCFGKSSYPSRNKPMRLTYQQTQTRMLHKTVDKRLANVPSVEDQRDFR